MKGIIVSKWGNGQGIRIPQAVLNLLSIGIGDQLSLSVKGDELILKPVKKKPKTLDELFADYDGPSYEELFKDEMSGWESMESVGKEIL